MTIDSVKYELAQKLVDTYAAYQCMLADKQENTRELHRVISAGVNEHAITTFDLRKLCVPSYIYSDYTQFKVMDFNVKAERIIGYRVAIEKLVDARLLLDKEYDRLTKIILDIKHASEANGLSMLQILQATDELGGEIVKSTAYKLIQRLEDRTSNRKLEKAAFYVLNQCLGFSITRLVEETGRTRSTIYSYIRVGRKLYELSDRSLENLSVEELLNIVRKNSVVETHNIS